MSVTETEQFLYYRVEALENALTEAQEQVVRLKKENKELKTDLLNSLIH